MYAKIAIHFYSGRVGFNNYLFRSVYTSFAAYIGNITYKSCILLLLSYAYYIEYYYYHMYMTEGRTACGGDGHRGRESGALRPPNR